MKDLTKYFIDLSKCSEEQRKSLPQILEKAGEEIYSTEKQWLENGEFDEPHLYLCDTRIWITSYVPNLTELTYPEFIKLFEGGEGENENIYDVDFGGNVMARIKIVDNKIEVTNAMNGYGNGIPLSEITITNSNQ